MSIHSIEDDLAGSAWFVELIAQTLADVEAYLARWAAFAEFLGETAA